MRKPRPLAFNNVLLAPLCSVHFRAMQTLVFSVDIEKLFESKGHGAGLCIGHGRTERPFGICEASARAMVEADGRHRCKTIGKGV